MPVKLKSIAIIIAALLSAAQASPLALVSNSTNPAPIVVQDDAPPLLRQAVDELASYIEKISGARPDVMFGTPQTTPSRAIWVGYQPEVNKLFPEIDFNFKHPEEILIAVSDQHVAIAGRDRWDPNHLVIKGKRETVTGVQQEYGTINAVYTFIHDFLDVRWLWPGDLGEDVIKRKTIAIEPTVYRFHPPLRDRDKIMVFSVLLRFSGYGQSFDWTRHQRIQLDSLEVSPGHAFKTWWERFHESHPEYFALQPDGTRSGFPGPEYAKLCISNPDVWQQWLKDVEAELEANPNMTVFNASPNDSYGTGHCTCDNCRAWDHPDAPKRPFIWQGHGERAPATSDRDVTFANHVARLLKEKYPDKEYYVSLNSYGNSRPAPMKTIPADNVIISNAANFFWDRDDVDKDTLIGTTYAQHFANWGKVTRKQIWRPNTGNPAGWMNAGPDVPLARIMDSFHFAVANGCIGAAIDSCWEHWATQGPLYYLLGRKAWDPSLDWRAVMDDYYRRGFGPAYEELKTYWQLLEDTRNLKVDHYGAEGPNYEQAYNDAFFQKAYGLLREADAKVTDAPKKYRDRIEFVRIGLDHTRLLLELRVLSLDMLLHNFKNESANDKVRAKWNEIENNTKRNPLAIYWPTIRPHRRMARAGLFHPDKTKKVKAKQIASWTRIAHRLADEPVDKKTVKPRPPLGTAWDVVFTDNFDRDTLGKNWAVVDGRWHIENGALVGGGTLISTRGFPGNGENGYVRLSFDAASETQDGTPPRVSDLSCFIHAEQEDDSQKILDSGYFFQFGGQWNKLNAIYKASDPLSPTRSSDTRIAPGKTHRVIAENDNGRLTLTIDGKTVFSALEETSILGDGHDHIGFYFYSPFRVMNVEVSVKRVTEGLDRD